MLPIKFATAWCPLCKLLIQCQYQGRKPVGIECTNCDKPYYVVGTRNYPLIGCAIGLALYLDWEEKK